MAKQKENNRRNPLLLILIVLLAAAVVLLAILLLRGSGDRTEPTAPAPELESGAEAYTGKRETYSGQKNTDTIDLPGFDVMNLQAGTTKQAVNLYNPEQNSCYFKISLLLSDRTLLWESKLLEPGMGVYEIELTQALEAGLYENAILKYECFAMDEKLTPLNGSEITLNLNVLT